MTALRRPLGWPGPDGNSPIGVVVIHWGSVTPPLFAIEDLHVAVDGVEILRGVDLVVDAGEVHALMGPNGSGKSTLANTLLGAPDYVVTRGHILLKGEDVTAWPTDVRAKAGMFLAFQYPEEIAGVPMVQFLQAGPVCPPRDRRPVDARDPVVDHGVDEAPRHGPVLR